MWVWMKKGRQGVGEQPRSDGGNGVGEDGSRRTEVRTSMTMVAGGEITSISGRAIMPRVRFAGMLVLDTKTQQSGDLHTRVLVDQP